jgi:hypothetical protein
LAPEAQLRIPGRALAGTMLAALCVAPAARAVDADTRIEGLEARLEALTRRVAALELVLSNAGPISAGTAAKRGEPVWDLDDYTSVAPFRVLHRSLDRDTGRVDLLLDITGSIPDPGRWSGLERDDPVPLVLSTDHAPGVAVDLLLERAGSLDPGSRVHLRAALPVEQATLAETLILRHRTEGQGD